MKQNNWGRVKSYPHRPLGEDLTVSSCYSKLSQLFWFGKNRSFFEHVSGKRTLCYMTNLVQISTKLIIWARIVAFGLSTRGLFTKSLPSPLCGLVTNRINEFSRVRVRVLAGQVPLTAGERGGYDMNDLQTFVLEMARAKARIWP